MNKFVICIDDSNYPVSLVARKLYESIPDEKSENTGFIRVIDETGDDYLYPVELFTEVHLSDEIVDKIFETI